VELLEKIKELKRVLEKEGFIINAIFGSFAAGEKNFNDIDLLYSLNGDFIQKYRGFIAFKKLEEIRNFLSQELGYKIDLAPMNNLSISGKKHIFKDIIYV